MMCPGDAELAGFVDGGLSAEARGSIEVHIDACRTCRQTVSEAARRSPKAATNAGEPGAGDRVGRYRLIAPLGVGAMGVVFSAHDPELDRRVAVKLLRVDATRQERLAREARALAKISHPNVVPVYDVGAAGDRLFVAMELVDGATLRAHVAAKALTLHARMQLLAQAAAGLAAAHAAGVVHRDFKPDNVLVGRDGRVRVSDFGLAFEEPVEGASDDGPALLTCTGALLGTPAYMAPEQLRGDRADAASDQFALCVTAWEVLFGRRPFAHNDSSQFTRNDARALLASIEQGPPDASGDRELVAALQRGLAFDPAQRHADLAPLISMLGDSRRSRRWIAVAAIASSALLGGGIVLASTLGANDDRCSRAEAGLDRVWTASARDRIAKVSTAAVASIETWATSWRTISGATCRAHHDGTRSAPLFDRQQACLAGRRDELAAMLALVGDIEPSRVPQLATSLGDLDACTATTFSPTPPTNAQARAEIDNARRELAAAKSLRKAGRYRDAIRDLEALRPRVDALPDRALGSELLWNLGMASIGADKLEAARDHFSAAAAEAEVARDDALKTRAWIELLVLVGDEVVALDEAARLEPLVRAALDRAEGGPALRAAFSAAIGRIELRKGRFEEAIVAFNEAITQHRKRTPIDRYELSNVMNSLSGAHGALGDHAKMLALLDESKALATAAVGADHPDVAAIWSNRVEPLHFLGRGADAMASAKKSVEIYERALGGKGIRLARAIENLAVLHAIEEQFTEAAALFDRSRAMTEQTLGPNHADVGQAWLNVASAYRDAGKLVEAAAGYEASIAIWEKALGADHVDLARPLLGLAKIHLERNEPTAALPLVERGVAIRESKPGNPAHVAHALFVHGQTVFALGDKPRACERISKSLATYMMATHALGKKYDDEVGEIRAWLAAQKLTCSADRRRER